MKLSKLITSGACMLSLFAAFATGCADPQPASQVGNHREAGDRNLCLESGGEWFGSETEGGCACGPYGLPGTFIPDEGGCVEDSVGQGLCEQTGGVWTDESSDAWYCLCPEGTESSFRSGKCETPTDAVASYFADQSDALPSELGLIHPELGVQVIHAPGVMATVNGYADLESALEAHPWLRGELAGNSCSLETAEPSFTCDGFEAEGCLQQEYVGYTRLSDVMNTTNDVLGDEIFSEDDLMDAYELQGHISRTVVVTYSYLEMAFGEIDGAWYLLVIDTAQYDCSA